MAEELDTHLAAGRLPVCAKLGCLVRRFPGKQKEDGGHRDSDMSRAGKEGCLAAACLINLIAGYSYGARLNRTDAPRRAARELSRQGRDEGCESVRAAGGRALQPRGFGNEIRISRTGEKERGETGKRD